VYERAKSPRELGFALLLAPNAVSALRELGLADTMIERGFVVGRGEVRRPDGTTLRVLDAAEVTARLGEPSVCALRPVLHGTLLEALGAEALELGQEVESFRSVAGGVELELAGGRRARGDVLIGADGTGSAIRRQLHPNEGAPRPSGLFAIRGVAYDVERHLGNVSGAQYLGRGLEAGIARASERATYWYLSVRAEDMPSDGRDPSALARTITSGFDAAFRAVVHATEPEDLRIDELFDRDPIANWGAGPVTLLGDAAHPMLPHAGQGAAQALEDAVALGRALRDGSPVEEGLRRYERVRSARTRAVVKLARRNARIGSMRHAAACWMRDNTMRIVPRWLIFKSMVALGKPPEVRAERTRA
jgi:2-polyprenyl-6-methoxyphenol hydroxylase-like FAD-dependent oxidoreductase